MKKILLVGVKAIKGESIIEENVDEKILSKVIANVQDIQLKPILGKALYETVCDEAREKAADNLYVIPEPTNELLNDYIQPFLIHAVVAEFVAINNYKISNKGVQKLNDNSSTSINASEVEYIKNYYDNYVSTYKNNLIKFLQDNNLIACGADSNITQPTTGWFLEGVGSCNNDSDDYVSKLPFVELDPVWLADKPNYVPTSRTITINGVTFDLSANRSWTISAGSTPTLQEVITAGAVLTSDNTISSPTGKIFTMKSISGANENKLIQDPTSLSIRSTTVSSFDELKVYGNDGVQINSNLGSYTLPRTTPTQKQVIRATVAGMTEWGNEGLDEVITADPVLQDNRQIQIVPNKYLEIYTTGTSGETIQKTVTDGFFVYKYPTVGFTEINNFSVTRYSTNATYNDPGVCDAAQTIGASGVISGYNNYTSDKGAFQTIDANGITLYGTFNSLSGYYNSLTIPSDNTFGMVFSSDTGGYTFPRTTPTVGQTLVADASGNLVFGTIGGGSTPNLDTVLSTGNTSINSIYLTDISSEFIVGDFSTYITSILGTDGNSGILKLSNSLGGNGILHFNNTVATDRDFELPRTSGTLVISVNSATADIAGDIALTETSGATGQTSYTTGDILYASATNTLSKLGIGTTGQVLTVAGGVPVWSTPSTGTVTTMSVASANGFAGTVATATTTPVITISTSITGLLKGNGTAISAATAGTDYLTPTGSAAGLTSFPTLNQNTTGSAATLTTARLINGTSFNGSADITITAAASTLTGTTLASGVTASSLTSFGTSPTMTGTLTVPTISLSTTISGAGTWTAGIINTSSNITGNNIVALGLLRAAASSSIQWNGRASMLSSADAVIDMRNNANSAYASVQSLYSRFGSGSPEGVVTAPIGTYYSRTDGGTGTSLYVKESGTGNTGWVAK